MQADNAITRALRSFSEIQDSARLDAIYALRHAFAHDYALFNPNTKTPSRQHAFNFRADGFSPLIALPKQT